MQQLHIAVHSLPDEGVQLREVLPDAFVGELLGAEELFAPRGSGQLTASLLPADDTLLLRGHVALPLCAPCSRCSEPSELTLAWDLDVTLVPQTATPEADEEGAICAEDAGVFVYRDDEVDVGDVLRDELLLNLPMQALCRPDCRGLCSHCGTSLNARSCSCSDEGPRGPLAELAHIRLSTPASTQPKKR